MSPTIITELLNKVFERLAPTVENQRTQHGSIFPDLILHCRTPRSRPTPGCGSTWSRTMTCGPRTTRRGRRGSSTLTASTPSWWRAPWWTTWWRDSVSSPRWGGCSTIKDTALDCRQVSLMMSVRGFYLNIVEIFDSVLIDWRMSVLRLIMSEMNMRRRRQKHIT